jgi:hypothetical protein
MHFAFLACSSSARLQLASNTFPHIHCVMNIYLVHAVDGVAQVWNLSRARRNPKERARCPRAPLSDSPQRINVLEVLIVLP